MLWHHFTIRLGLALILGALIGAERHWRQRMAGLRTNALAAAGAAMFVMLTALTTRAADDSFASRAKWSPRSVFWSGSNSAKRPNHNRAQYGCHIVVCGSDRNSGRVWAVGFCSHRRNCVYRCQRMPPAAEKAQSMPILLTCFGSLPGAIRRPTYVHSYLIPSADSR